MLHHGDLDGALVHLLEAVALDPRNADARENLGRVYEQRGERQLAERHLVEAARLRGLPPAGGGRPR